jgi:LPXTG-motif cell wall-anchored protein
MSALAVGGAIAGILGGTTAWWALKKKKEKVK